MAKKQNLKIIPLGGLEEIGKNITVFEYGNDIVVLDCGMAFPDEEMPGVDIVIPDFAYLEKNQDKIRAVVLTHGHEDHIGALPYFLSKINVPVYGTRLTIGLVLNKLKEHGLDKTVKLHSVLPGNVLKLGEFRVEFIRSNHSIPDAAAIAFHTPVGIILHTGDFKIDSTPIEGKMIDLKRIGELGKKGILALMSDSTNAERPGYTMSESTVGAAFDEIFRNNIKNRIIVATFASNIHRMQQIVNSAAQYGRKIALSGRSIVNVVTVAVELGHMKIPKGMLIDIDEITNYPPHKLVIITTGSQGEAMLSEALEKVAAEAISPDVKILKLIETHLDTIKMIVLRNGSLRASFFRDIWRVERVRRNFNNHEIALFKQILSEGKEKGIFEVDNIDILADILHYCVKGIEVPFIRGKIGEELTDRQGWEYVAKIVYGALGHKQ